MRHNLRQVRYDCCLYETWFKSNEIWLLFIWDIIAVYMSHDLSQMRYDYCLHETWFKSNEIWLLFTWDMI